ncbi:hypothetical protein CP10139811_0189 [Chlamydia ibidis]|uniref:Uncharacterized protein n=2 Tax=Chlamydia ibidis TaxID=1405396 RepID=S7KGN1_9CHLA|nr:hypothetical protein [Chlamydia ibidis]EPP35316.1 hypothetical protein CP10139811_0189 [Chlamydia ibidis]EQM62517.1 putative membrane protein [Chlamydia ibidis 10-1398/6]
MVGKALGIIGAISGIAALACVLNDELDASEANERSKPQRPVEYTVSSPNDAEFLLRDIEKLKETLRSLHFSLPSWLTNDIEDVESGAEHVLEVAKNSDNKAGLGILQGLFDHYYQIRNYLNRVCKIGDGTKYGITLGNVKYYGSKTEIPHFTIYHPIQVKLPSPLQGKSRIMTISIIAILSILSLVSLVALGTLGGLSIVAAPISIGVSAAIILGFAITVIVLIGRLKSRIVTEYEKESVPVSCYQRPINWDKHSFY